MRFYGRGIVWDKENDRTLMKFVDGKFETDDPRIIELLLAGGYEHGVEIKLVKREVPLAEPATENVAESVAEEVHAKATADLDVKELRELGKQRGLAFKPGTTKIDMAKAINAK
jgi:hypothetical protein